MKKRIVIIGLVIAFCLSLSVGVCAETFEGDCESNAEVIVDEKNNTIEFIYAQSKDEVVDGVFEDIPDNAWPQLFGN